MPETVLIVDDEDAVRRTFAEWLAGSGLGVAVLEAADAEEALVLANAHPVDLAVLDWNLGTGTDGLRLLEDLVEFRPDLVAILVTGFANVATPLDALRMGVRDYLDKNQDLTRDTFLASVRKQLAKIAPMKRQRELNGSLALFREAVGKALPLVRSAAALQDGAPLPRAAHALVRFLLATTGAAGGVLLVRHDGPDGAERFTGHGPDGEALPPFGVPFARTMAAAALSLGEPVVVTDLSAATADGSVELIPPEVGRASLLAVPLPLESGAQAVLELFDKAFTDADRRLAASAADVGAELLRQAFAERHTYRLLGDAVEAALQAGDDVRKTLDAGAALASPSAPTPPAVLEGLRRGLDADARALDGTQAVELLEAVRALAVRHGPTAVDHCRRLVESVRRLLDEVAGGEAGGA